jgi:hypothetical protein
MFNMESFHRSFSDFLLATYLVKCLIFLFIGMAEWLGTNHDGAHEIFVSVLAVWKIAKHFRDLSRNLKAKTFRQIGLNPFYISCLI